jgi:hypothetical protein
VVNWRRAEELLAETAREVGVLMAVFTPLEAAFSDKTTGVGLVAGGIIIGARR